MSADQNPTNQITLKETLDSSIFKMLVPIVVSAALAMLTGSVNKLIDHVDSLDKTMQQNAIDKSDMLSRIKSLESTRETRNVEMAANNNKMDQLREELAQLKYSRGFK